MVIFIGHCPKKKSIRLIHLQNDNSSISSAADRQLRKSAGSIEDDGRPALSPLRI
jgi:hypothetical protein